MRELPLQLLRGLRIPLRLKVGVLSAVALVLLTAAFLGAARSVFVPGPTSDGHHLFEASCASCHAPFRGSPRGKCTSCHPPDRAPDTHAAGLFDDPRWAHTLEEIDAQECVACHGEHRRADGGVTVGRDFCMRCHDDVLDTRPQRFRATVGVVCIALACALGAWVFFRGPSWSLPVVWIAIVFATMASNVIIRAFSTELFPTSQRATSAGMLSLAETLGAGIGLMTLSILTRQEGDLVAMLPIVASATLISAFLLLFFPETKQTELEAISSEEPPPAGDEANFAG